jgi:adenine deaminase
MKSIKGNIFNPISGQFQKGELYFNERIFEFVQDDSVVESIFVLPGLVDAHVHIESSMLSPIEYSRESLRHGVVASVTDPHEIANVCGLEGVRYMVKSASLLPMKIFTGVPSCVPATTMESSGATIDASDVETLFNEDGCFHLAEMMNFPGVLFNDPSVVSKLQIAKKLNKRIDGHAPMLSGADLLKYISAGITTDHECVTLGEALEKISLGMMIMLRESSASKDFDKLDRLIELQPKSVMFCTDDCHPDDLQKGYIDQLFRKAVNNGYPISNIVDAASINAIVHYDLPVGYLRMNDFADFIVVDNLTDFTVLKTFINGVEVFDGKKVFIEEVNLPPINNFFCNTISPIDISVEVEDGKKVNVIDIIPDSLLTRHIAVDLKSVNGYIESDLSKDILKIVVLNRYCEAKPTVGFIKGFGLTYGAFGGSVAHDSHNIIVVGVNDDSILRAIEIIQQNKGGLVAVDNENESILSLPIAGLMSDKPCNIVAEEYENITNVVREMGSTLRSPFMTLAFMALLVIPELKIGDKGLFDVSTFSLIDLQS